MPTRRATLGSTSYDDALHEEERAWHGAAWYGVTTGTYWRPNPREYADPRKHGPEYEARARRAASLVDEPGDPVRTAGAEAEAEARAEAEAEARAEAMHRPPDDARSEAHEFARGATAGAAARAAREPGPGSPNARTLRQGRPARFRSPTWAAASPADPLPERLAGFLLATPRRARLTFAAVGWPFLSLLAVGAAGELTGCDRYAAGCPVDADTWTLLGRLAAAGLFLALLALPPLAVRAAIAGVAALVVAVPGAALLAVFGGTRDPAGAAGALTVLIAAAWLVGAVGAAVGRFRLPPALRARVPWWP